MTAFPVFDPYVHRAALHRVIDGDSVVLTVDRGWDDFSRKPVRLLGLDCPEDDGATRDAGLAARAFTEAWFAGHATPGEPWPFVLRSARLDKYRRSVGTVYAADGTSLNAALLDAGHAEVYP